MSFFTKFTYIPRKAKIENGIYNNKIAHRGYHFKYPENSIPAFIEAINRKNSIEIDIRLTKDGVIVCIHDRYAKKLLGTKGKTSNMTYKQIEKCTILKSKDKVPTLKDVLDLVNGRVALLIEVKGLMNHIFENKIVNMINEYNGVVFFHAKNIITYFKLRKIYGDKVFWILNVFRKRFDFVKFKRKHIY